MADIRINEQAGFGLATIVPADATIDAMAQVAAAVAGMADLLATGPQQALAYADQGAPDWADGLCARLTGLARVVDQSSAYALFVLTGIDAGRLLQKGLAVDLAEQSFPVGGVVVSAIAQIGVIAHHRAPRQIDLLVPRSLAASFRDWLDTGMAALT